MKFYEKLNVQIRRLGIFYWDTDPKKKKIAIATRRGLIVIYTSFFSSSAYFLIYVAQMPREYSESLFIVLPSLLIVSWYAAMLFQSREYATLIDEINTIIEKSKYTFH